MLCAPLERAFLHFDWALWQIFARHIAPRSPIHLQKRPFARRFARNSSARDLNPLPPLLPFLALASPALLAHVPRTSRALTACIAHAASSTCASAHPPCALTHASAPVSFSLLPTSSLFIRSLVVGGLRSDFPRSTRPPTQLPVLSPSRSSPPQHPTHPLLQPILRSSISNTYTPP